MGKFDNFVSERYRDDIPNELSVQVCSRSSPSSNVLRVQISAVPGLTSCHGDSAAAISTCPLRSLLTATAILLRGAGHFLSLRHRNGRLIAALYHEEGLAV
jgi:hypothetical protein